jgi:hypothetical protein
MQCKWNDPSNRELPRLRNCALHIVRCAQANSITGSSTLFLPRSECYRRQQHIIKLPCVLFIMLLCAIAKILSSFFAFHNTTTLSVDGRGNVGPVAPYTRPFSLHSFCERSDKVSFVCRGILVWNFLLLSQNRRSFIYKKTRHRSFLTLYYHISTTALLRRNLKKFLVLSSM